MGKTKTTDVLGSDLALTPWTGAPSGVPLESADSWGSLDVQAVLGGRSGQPSGAEDRDIGVASGRANLAQALILRLLTHRGDLSPLGHPDYGSRLIELIGERNDEGARNLARLFTLEAVAQEPRVRDVLGLSIETAPGSPDTIRIAISVSPIDDGPPLAVALELTL